MTPQRRREAATPSKENAIGMFIQPHFRDRSEAGERLARRLDRRLGGLPSNEILVLALPRGGVLVAKEIAKLLVAPLDLFTVRPLPVSGDPGVAIGAVATGGVRLLNEATIRAHGLSEEVVARMAKEEQRALTRSESLSRGDRPLPVIRGKTVILVADGASKGGDVRAAAAAIRTHDPVRIIAALPVASPEALRAIEDSVDEVLCEWKPDPFYGIEVWYEDFEPLSEADVRRVLEGGTAGTAGDAGTASQAGIEAE